MMASDPVLTAIFYKAVESPAELTDTERRQIEFVFDAMWGMSENAYFARKHGVLGDSEWSRFERVICENRETVDWTIQERLLTDEFKLYLQNC